MPLPATKRHALLSSPLLLLMSACAGTPRAPAATPLELTPADSLASHIALAAGDPYTMQGLRFTFVVRAEGQDKVRRTHTWCPQTGQVQVLVQGETHGFELRSVQETEPALGWFINDSYWLLAATKVMDPGALRSVDQEQLLLSFDGVGLTPGDRYWMRSDAQGLVRSWRFELQGGGAGEYQWLDYEQVGPLQLSARRVNEAGREILFQDIAALQDCPL